MRKGVYAAASLIAIVAVPSHAQTTNAVNPSAATSAIQAPAPQDMSTQQDLSAPQTTDGGQSTGRLADIVVTAQRRSQRIEQVPVSVQVITGAAVTEFQQTDLVSLSASAPNLVLTASPSGAVQANIRGVGTSTANAGFEQTVALYVDGIYQPRPNSYTGSLFDIDRVEIVKGTQGTLFGKNASVGAIGVFTRDPKAAFGGYLDALYDFTLEGPRLEGGVNLPASDTLRLRVAGLYTDDHRGWLFDVPTNRKFPTNREQGIRGKGDWDVTPKFTINGKLEYNQTDRVGNTLALVPGNVVGGGVDIGSITTSIASNFLPENDGLPGFHRRSNTEAIGANWRLDGVTITALSGWTGLRTSSFQDFVPAVSPIDAAVIYYERFNQFTQELRVTSDESKPFEYIAGLFYLDQNLSFNQLIRANIPSLVANQTLATDLRTYSGFIQGKYKFNHQLALTLGGRVTNEAKKGTLVAIKPAGTGVTPGKAKTTNFDWDGILEYKFVEDTRLYTSISRGHKGPGFLNTIPGGAIVTTQLILRGEEATNYEAGIKSRFLGGRARANLAIYDLEVKDYQGSQFVPALFAFVSSNIDTRSRGVEGELAFQVARPLSVSATAAYNHGIIKATGNQNLNSPRWNVTGSINYTPQLTDDLQGQLSGQVNYIDKFPNQFDLQPGNFTPAHTNLDLRIGLKERRTGITLAIIGRNVTNERYADFAGGYPFGPANTVFQDTIAKPRTISVELIIPFGRQ